MRDATVVRNGLAACRAALADTGVLLVQDATLPSVTTFVAGAPVRIDTVEVAGSRRRADVVRDVEHRLLIASEEVHTESGRHSKVLQSWPTWAAAAGLDRALPDPTDARAAFERSYQPVLDATGVQRSPFPWPSEVSQ